MNTLKEIFDLSVAKSLDTSDYEDGLVPFISSTEANNGIVRYVQPLEGDNLFQGPCVVISGLGFASVHAGQILPKGNGGDSCTILIGKQPMAFADYIAFAGEFNCLHRWRFSFGRKCSKSRVENLSVPWPVVLPIDDMWPSQKRALDGCVRALSIMLKKTADAEK